VSWTGVLFDLDGALVDTVDLILKSYRYTMEVHLGEVPPDARFLETIGQLLPIQLADFARSEDERLAILQTYVVYQRSVHDEMVQPFPGAIDGLNQLKGGGIRVGVVASKGHRIA